MKAGGAESATETRAEGKALAERRILRALPLWRKIVLARGIRSAGWDLAAPDLRPVIDSVFPLEQAHDAHHRMDSGLHQGKIILQVI